MDAHVGSSRGWSVTWRWCWNPWRRTGRTGTATTPAQCKSAPCAVA